MTEAGNHNMVLANDARRDRRHRERVAAQMQDQWQAYQRGKWPVQLSEGRISKLFFYPGGRQTFELDEGTERSTWVRQGNDSWYVVGGWARVEQVVFHATPPVGDVPVVTQIWIENAASAWMQPNAP